MPVHYPDPDYNPHLFPWWVVRKIGQPILLESDWYSVWGGKWGALVTGTGTGFQLYRDNEQQWGGSACALMRTGNVTDDTIEIKTQHSYEHESLLAFEHRFMIDANPTTNRWDFGIEARTDSIVQGRCKLDIANDEWLYETTQDVYVSFNPRVIINRTGTTAPLGLTTGSTWGWARLVIDPLRREYVKFECAGKAGIEVRDLAGIPLVDRGTTGAGFLLLFFVLGYTGSPGGSNQVYRTTDWCVSRIYREEKL